MRVLVCGSRGLKTAGPMIFHRLSQLPKDTLIVHGGAPGVDSWADSCAWELGLETEVHPADWNRYGKRAGIIRNLDMLDTEPDLVIAYWDGQSPGTQHTMREAEARGIQVELHLVPIQIPLEKN